MQTLARNLFAILAMQLALISCAHAQSGLSNKDTQFSQTWLEQVRRNVADEHLLAAVLVAKLHDEALASALLLQALGSLEHDPLLLSTAVQSCFSVAPTHACGDNALFEELVHVDAGNLEPYLYYMLRLVEAGNAERALEMLHQGMQAARHTIYFSEKADFLSAQLLAVGYPSAEEVIQPAQAYAGASTNYSIFLKILSTCTTQSVVSAQWKLACLFLGTRLQSSSQDLMSKVFGGAIQRDVLKAVGADPQVIQLIVERNEWVNKVRDMANDKVDWMSPTSTPLDQPDSFLQDMKEVTEFDAILRAIYRAQ